MELYYPYIVNFRALHATLVHFPYFVTGHSAHCAPCAMCHTPDALCTFNHAYSVNDNCIYVFLHETRPTYPTLKMPSSLRVSSSSQNTQHQQLATHARLIVGLPTHRSSLSPCCTKYSAS